MLTSDIPPRHQTILTIYRAGYSCFYIVKDRVNRLKKYEETGIDMELNIATLNKSICMLRRQDKLPIRLV